MLRLPDDSRISRLSPVCLPATPPTKIESFLGIRCLATGWGQTQFGGELQSDLHQVELTVVNNSICGDMYEVRYSTSIGNTHLCAGARDSNLGKGTCVVGLTIFLKISLRNFLKVIFSLFKIKFFSLRKDILQVLNHKQTFHLFFRETVVDLFIATCATASGISPASPRLGRDAPSPATPTCSRASPATWTGLKTSWRRIKWYRWHPGGGHSSGRSFLVLMQI